MPRKFQGAGYAPNYSISVEQASDAVHDAEVALLDALKRAYPLGTTVRVVHPRGSFMGEVDGWDHHGTQVAVRNFRSGKTNKWWAAHVELISGRVGE